MENSLEVVDDENVFLEIRNLALKICHPDKDIIDGVFQSEFYDFRFTESCICDYSTIKDVIRAVHVHSKERIYCIWISSNYKEFLCHFNCYPALIINTELSEEKYIKGLESLSLNDPIHLNYYDGFVLFSDSQNWCIYQSVDMEALILGFKKGFCYSFDVKMWFNLTEVLDEWVFELKQEAKEGLHKNYANLFQDLGT